MQTKMILKIWSKAVSRQRIELKLTNTDNIHFKAPLYCYMTKVSDDKYDVWHKELSIRASGNTPTAACQLIKDLFIELALDINSKSMYTSLGKRDQEKFEIIRSVCLFV